MIVKFRTTIRFYLVVILAAKNDCRRQKCGEQAEKGHLVKFGYFVRNTIYGRHTHTHTHTHTAVKPPPLLPKHTVLHSRRINKHDVFPAQSVKLITTYIRFQGCPPPFREATGWMTKTFLFDSLAIRGPSSFQSCRTCSRCHTPPTQWVPGHFSGH